MRRSAWVAAIAALFCVPAVGCRPNVEEPEEPARVVEHRVGPCRTSCESWMDPECGNLNHPSFPTYESLDACIELCAEVGSVWHWGPQEDGSDACIEPWEDYAACLSSLSCEENLAHWATPPSQDFPCKEERGAQVDCGGDHPPLAEGGS